jgi:16S rRNA (cytosine967-C5)-methyltransferase
VRVQRDGAYADVLLGRRLTAFIEPDRRLLTQLVLGTLAWRGRLDFELAQYSSRRMEQLNPEVLSVLRLGLFQLRMLTRVPPHAAVDTAVTLARESNGAAAGFVNAILRNAIRKPVSLPRRGADELRYLSVAYSHPRWLVKRFVQWFGLAGCEELLAANNQPAPNVLRLNLARTARDDAVARLAQDGMTIARNGLFPETVILKGAPVLDGAAWRDGLFQPQSEASQLVSHLLAPSPGSLIIDCTAAPGGKTTHLAELAGPRGRVLAFDLNFGGLLNVRSVAARLRHNNVLMTCADASQALPIRVRAAADFVLLDAPCTGLGTLRQHPEIRWRLKPEDIERMAALQRLMLEQASATVRVGGAMVYSVCSLAPEEGPEVVASFIAQHSNFQIDRTPGCVQPLRLAVDDRGFLRTRPDRGGMDGFFGARLKRCA